MMLTWTMTTAEMEGRGGLVPSRDLAILEKAAAKLFGAESSKTRMEFTEGGLRFVAVPMQKAAEPVEPAE